MSSGALPELNYETPMRNSRVVTAAWISLLMLGVFYGLGATCIGIPLLGIIFGPSGFRAPEKLLVAIVVLFLATSSAVYCWASIRVSKRSRPAAKVAFIMGMIQTVLLSALCVLGLAILPSKGGDEFLALLLGVSIWGVMAAGNGHTARLQWKVMKELNPQ